ncbi:hypothetical protein HW555_009767 [Spodoptera exigua]|uniref:Uncharacterized protein n=1 Tax=Spodoptera exigua TaxID=7107 RepID=A0A835GBR2_SPOEX|nr:hypothetical protein HW555_009767 [Spodoptera exigua]
MGEEQRRRPVWMASDFDPAWRAASGHRPAAIIFYQRSSTSMAGVISSLTS